MDQEINDEMREWIRYGIRRGWLPLFDDEEDEEWEENGEEEEGKSRKPTGDWTVHLNIVARVERLPE